LHFADLDPIRFEDLCLGLVYPFRPWLEIRHYGRLGGDGGVDILAVEPVDHGGGRTWFIQCKRLGKATKVTLTKAVDDALNKSTSPPFALLVVLACDVTKEAQESFHLYATEKGVVTPILWTASTLEARLYGDRNDLLFAYFGISLGRRENAEAAQFYAVEYLVLMGRVSKLENLQYAAWLILPVALVLLSQFQVTVSYRLWAALISTLLVYVANQGIMMNMLYTVLVIEQDLRPLAGKLVTTYNFWIYERVSQKAFPTNPAWSPWWPPLIALLAITLAGGGIVYEYGFHWQDAACFLVAFYLWMMIWVLTRNGLQLRKAITEACSPAARFAESQLVSDDHEPRDAARAEEV
jgi:hypothetical protein